MKLQNLLLVGMLTAIPAGAGAQESSPEKKNNRPGLLKRQGGPALGEGRGPELMARAAGALAKNIPIMKALDLDEDGQLSASEIENASKSLIKLDKNGDGILGAEELQPEPGPWMNLAGSGGPRGPGAPGAGMPEGNPAMMLRMFANRDKDGDGKLSGDEIPEPMRERLSIVDANGDGSVDKSEIETMAGRVKDRLGKRSDKQSSGSQGVLPQRPPREEKTGGNK